MYSRHSGVMFFTRQSVLVFSCEGRPTPAGRQTPSTRMYRSSPRTPVGFMFDSQLP